jgi:hypothetical protein
VTGPFIGGPSGWTMTLTFSAGTISEWFLDATNGFTTPDIYSYHFIGGNLYHEEGFGPATDTDHGLIHTAGVTTTHQFWSLAQVPGPGSLALLALGLAGFAFGRKRKPA